MPYNKPFAEEIQTTELCNYGCEQQARYVFRKGKLCCSKHYNSCPAKRKSFSENVDHLASARKSLETRTRLGITQTSQIKGGETRRAQGHYKNLAKKMQQHWKDNPWNNNTRCPMLKFKSTSVPYQGTYELKFLEDLEVEHGLEWIENNVKRGPSLWYKDPVDLEHRLYISDFIIGDTIYEIKSSWTWNKKGKDIALEEKNKAKLTECVYQGYNVILVLNQKRLTYEEIMG